MAPYESAQGTEEVEDRPTGRGKAARYAVPVAVAGVAAATIGLVPALASSGDPDLPKITAQELVEKIAASDVQRLSGNVKISTDLGLPSLGGAAASSFAPKGGDGEGGSAASPETKLMELASGTHNLRIAADGPDKQKLSILEDAAEYSVIHNGGDVWAYDSKSNEAFHARDTDKGAHGKGDEKGAHGKGDDKGVHGKGDERGTGGKTPATPKELADEALKAVDDTTSVTVDGTARIAGRDAYQLLIQPKGSGSTIGSIRIAVDADNGVPLKFTLTPSSGGKAAIDAGFTKVDFAKPAASTFDFKPAKGMKVTEADELEKHARDGKGMEKHAPKGLEGADGIGGGFGGGMAGMAGKDGMKVIGEGWSSIAVLDAGGQGMPSKGSGPGSGSGSGSGEVPPEAQGLLDAFGDKVTGKFGSGTVFSTRLVNALMTDDGKVYVGAVDKDALVKAANAAK
ncbi:outer membrane lipoprotein carrier protein LolA [Streptomyces monticola]|uniref:Outer membrane lipoprotein carrier protein LolA n=1 Tax=Streptomyces monticola TaxID=2666263 RepID=A0ABW2JXD6_9ACTN